MYIGCAKPTGEDIIEDVTGKNGVGEVLDASKSSTASVRSQKGSKNLSTSEMQGDALPRRLLGFSTGGLGIRGFAKASDSARSLSRSASKDSSSSLSSGFPSSTFSVNVTELVIFSPSSTSFKFLSSLFLTFARDPAPLHPARPVFRLSPDLRIKLVEEDLHELCYILEVPKPNRSKSRSVKCSTASRDR
jgi:hypothetical protein